MIILQAIYFFLPAYLANMAPVFAAKIFGKRFDQPIDGNKTFRGQRILGDHKTWRGLTSGVVVAILIILIQLFLFKYPRFGQLSIFNYQTMNVILIGGLMGFGALAGDAIKSFFKRQLRIAPGKSWPVFDQLDFVIGGLLAASIIVSIPWQIIIILLIVSPVLHITANYIGYLLKLKSTPW